ncbi:hypothetical protein N9917_03550 [Deltaproteobacteria bacterium]|nr:hypothetical protein [Deltaproteobacteria bacterium]
MGFMQRLTHAQRDILGAAVSLILLLTFAVGWQVWYVQPREDFLLAVAECTGDDLSQSAWDQCYAEVRKQTL